jgi:uncharacterized membrane protein
MIGPFSLRKILFTWQKPWGAFLLSFLVYACAASLQNSLFGMSNTAYYNYLADAFLHGQVNLRLIPDNVYDLVHFGGKYYLYWAPMPAIVLSPFVAIWGVKFSDIFFNVILAAANVGLMTYLIDQLRKKEIVSISDFQHSLLSIFFAIGTVHITLAPFGSVWQTGQLVGFCFTLLAYIISIKLDGKLAFFLTGLALAAAFLTRNHLLFTGIWPAYYLWQKNRHLDWKKLILFAILGIMPIFIGGLSQLGYNWLRFANPFDIGLDYHLMNPFFKADYEKYGAFNIHYLPINFFYQYISYPFLVMNRTFNGYSLFYMGGSLFLLSPVFFLAFRGLQQLKPILSSVAAALAILITDIPILLLMGTGMVQFGPRYTLDFTVPLMLLTAAGLKNIPDKYLNRLVLISIAHYIAGTLIFILKAKG